MLLNSHMRARIKRHATAFKAELHAATLFDFFAKRGFGGNHEQPDLRSSCEIADLMKSAKTGGRKRGTPNKMTASAKAALMAAFDGSGGVAALTASAKVNPGAFYALWAKVLPMETHSTKMVQSVVNVTLFEAN